METVKAVSTLFATAATGYAVGSVADFLGNKYGATYPIARVALQFGLGSIALAETVSSLGGYALSTAAVGEASMIFFFYTAQTGMLVEVALLKEELAGELNSIL